MRRRTVATLTAALLSSCGRAQPGAAPAAQPTAASVRRSAPRRIALIFSVTAQNSFQGDEFLAGLTDLGYALGRDYELLRISSDGPERPADIAAEVGRLAPDLIVHAGGLRPEEQDRIARGPYPVLRPINWPDATGHVASLARPGLSVTGPALTVPEVAAKRLELLAELVPGLDRTAYIDDSALVPEAVRTSLWEATRAAGQALGIHVERTLVPSAPQSVAAVDEAALAGVGAFLFGQSGRTEQVRRDLVAAVGRHGGRAIFAEREYVEDGALGIYGVNVRTVFRRMAGYADRIFKGAGPADIPVEMPTRYDLILNLKTAASLGVAVPRSVLQRATEVLQ